MAQYRVGTVLFTSGSAIVTAVDPDPADPAIGPAQLWLSEVSPGDLLVVKTEAIPYPVASVQSDTQLTLTVPFAGPTTVPAGTPQLGTEYGIVVDFSPVYSFPLISAGDIATAVVLQQAMDMIDTQLDALNARLVALGV